VSVDLLVKSVVGQALASLKSDPRDVDLIFSRLSVEAREEIKAYFASATIHLRLGWTQHDTELPCVAITLPTEQEDGQYIGSRPSGLWVNEAGEQVSSSYADGGKLYQLLVAEFSGACDSAVYGGNATETTWIAQALKWMLLRYRTQLENSGLEQQRLVMTDFMPAQDYPQPDPAYTRVVKLSYVAYEVYTAPPEEIIPIRAVIVTEPEDPEDQE
jgi:hypothetical protein